MKMTRSTSTTSTSGVTLMSEITSVLAVLVDACSAAGHQPASPLASCAAVHVAEDHVGHRVGAPDLAAHPPLVEVEGDHRRDGDQDADRGGHQRARHVGADHVDAGVLRLVLQAVERRDDAEHGAEQADERGVVAQGAEHDQVLLLLLADARLLAVHRLGDRVGAALALAHAGTARPGPPSRVERAEALLERVAVAAGERLLDLALERRRGRPGGAGSRARARS